MFEERKGRTQSQPQSRSTRNALDPEVAPIAVILLLIQSSPSPRNLHAELVLFPSDLSKFILDALNTPLNLGLGGKISHRSRLDDPVQLFNNGFQVDPAPVKLVPSGFERRDATLWILWAILRLTLRATRLLPLG